jgi:hypothetical protein
MLDPYSRNQIITELENVLQSMSEEYGNAIPRYIVRAAFNARGSFPGDLLPVPDDLPHPNEVFFQEFASKMRKVYTTLAQKAINPTKQEMDDMVNYISSGLVI